MAFVDKQLNAGTDGKTVTALGLTKTAPMTLEVAAGSVKLHATGVTYTLAAAESHVFTADSTNPTRVLMALIDNGTTTDLWVDAYVVDGLNEKGKIPAGYSYIADIGWFDIAANETDLLNGDVNRRVWI